MRTSASSKSRLAIHLLAGVEVMVIASMVLSGFWLMAGEWMGMRWYVSILFYSGAVSVTVVDHTVAPGLSSAASPS